MPGSRRLEHAVANQQVIRYSTLVQYSMRIITRVSRTAAFGASSSSPSHLGLCVAKYAAGWNTWPHNVPERRGEVHVQGAVAYTLLSTADLSSRNQSHPRP